MPAVNAMASAPQNVTRMAARHTIAPPAMAPIAPSSARNKSEAPASIGTSRAIGTRNTISKGNAAPQVNVAAYVRAAWIGRAVVISNMPSSSRAWVASASLAINWRATESAVSRSRPRRI